MAIDLSSQAYSPEWLAEYQKRRTALLELMWPDSLLVWPTFPLRYRNHDVAFPYRPESSFYYLCGAEDPSATLVLEKKTGRFLLFCQERSPQQQRWEGASLGCAGAREILGADAAYPLEKLEEYLLGALHSGVSTVYFPEKIYSAEQAPAWHALWTRVLKKRERQKILRDPSPLLAALRVIKSPLEQEAMHRAAQISVGAHMAWMSFVKRQKGGDQPQAFEYQLEALFLQECYYQGAQHQAYPPIVAGGNRACTLHYHNNNQALEQGSCVLVDAGCEWLHYASDITRVMPMGGLFTRAQRSIYELVLEAQEAGIAVAKPGMPLEGIQTEIVRVFRKGLPLLGMREDYQQFYMHKAGHWLGLDVHDPGPLSTEEGVPLLLKPGMALTIEPGLYFSAEDPHSPLVYRGIGVRIEDDFIITETGVENLTAALPKTIEALAQL